MRWSLTRGQTAAIALLVAALLVDAVLTLHNIREVATSVQWVSHTHEVLTAMYLGGQIHPVVGKAFRLAEAPIGLRELADRQIPGKAVVLIG